MTPSTPGARPALAGLALALALALVAPSPAPAAGRFRAGAATTNVTPWLGLSMNGGMSDNPVKDIHDELHARAIVLDDGATRLAFVIVDSCMLPREVVAEARDRIRERSHIDPSHVLIAATHAHSAPTAGPVFQSEPDPAYLRFLVTRISDAVELARNRLAPAQIGWGFGRNDAHLFNRRWHLKPGTVPPNPFGETTDRVQMNPPPGSPNLIEPAGPTDPEVAVIAVRSPDGRPLALLSAYGLHYVGGVGPGHASADYFGAFARKIAPLLNAGDAHPPFVAALANGTSGDVNNVNFRAPRPPQPPYEQIDRVAADLAAEAARVALSLTYHDNVTLDARTTDLKLAVRRPSAADLARAATLLAEAAGKPLATTAQIYAREALLLDKFPNEVEATIQALRIGPLGIVAIPCEVFTEIGLEIKAKSPLRPTFTIELANGYNGYLPTRAQHQLGGYETWRARSSYLEVDAADKIVKCAQTLLQQLAAPR